MSEKSHTTPGSVWAAPRSVADIGAFVADVRRAAGLTQAQLAEHAAVSRRFVNELETGHSTLFADRLLALLRELGVQVRLDVYGPDGTGSAESHPAASAQAQVEGVPPVKDLGW